MAILSISQANTAEGRIMATVGQVNLLTKNDLENNQNWRFVPDKGVLIALKPIQLNNQELRELANGGKYGVASLEELRLAYAPYDAKKTLVDKVPKFPWGNKDDMNDAGLFYKKTGISKSGIAMGIHPKNYWAVLRDGIRIGGAYNVLRIEPSQGDLVNIDADANQRALMRAAFERGSLRGQMEGSVARDAGIYAGKELEMNEAYLLVRKPTAQELEFFAKTREAANNALSDDGGILVICPPDFEQKKFFFTAAGKCHDCPNIDTITAIVQKKLIKDATGLDGELLPEYKDWNKIYTREHPRIKAASEAFGALGA